MAVVHLVKQLLFISLTRVRIQFHRTLIVCSLHKIMNIKRGNKWPPFTLVGSGPLGRAFAPDTRDPYFESFHIFELFNYNWESKLPKPNGSAVKRHSSLIWTWTTANHINGTVVIPKKVYIKEINKCFIKIEPIFNTRYWANFIVANGQNDQKSMAILSQWTLTTTF